jgi:NADH-quinone oxidoreductase subunit J
MILYLIIYYIIIIAIVATGIGIVLSKNPINAVLYLILMFILASILFFCFGAEFFAIMFATIYIGAIAVLFLFVIMMLNVKIVELRVSYYIYLPVTVLVIFFLLLEFKYILYSGDGNSIFLLNLDYVNWFVFINDKSVVDRIGFVLYNEFIFYFFFVLYYYFWQHLLRYH